MISHFGPRGKIAYVHFRDVQGSVPRFVECFLGEGNFNPSEMIGLLRDSGFDGFLLDDHVPQIENDSPWGHRARGHAVRLDGEGEVVGDVARRVDRGHRPARSLQPLAVGEQVVGPEGPVPPFAPAAAMSRQKASTPRW